ncbi:MAG: hypothetical protein H0W50_06310 [Parachlamydiaceae bacterium]|nr:hypothetical protein [Parachlamydiaceae bacterium]
MCKADDLGQTAKSSKNYHNNNSHTSSSNSPHVSTTTDDLIEFDDFPDNRLPELVYTEPLFEEESKAIFEKKTHDFTSLPDADEIISLQSELGIDIHGHPSALVNGCINVISGEYQEAAIDFSLPGVKPLNIQRNYFGGKCKKKSFLYGWQLSHGAKLFSYWSKHNHFYAFIKGSERHGVFYKEVAEATGRFVCPPAFFKKGVTNCAFGDLSAKSNFKNDELRNLAEDSFELQTADQAFFKFVKSSHDPERISGAKLVGYKLEIVNCQTVLLISTSIHTPLECRFQFPTQIAKG